MIINDLTKIIYYKPVKFIFNVFELAKIILDIVIQYYRLLSIIIIDKGLLFIFKLDYCDIISLRPNRDLY